MKKSEYTYRLKGALGKNGARLAGYGVIKAGAILDAKTAEKLRQCGYGRLLEQVPAWESSNAKIEALKAEAVAKAKETPVEEVSESEEVVEAIEDEKPVKPKKSRKKKASEETETVEVEGNEDASESASENAASESEAVSE